MNISSFAKTFFAAAVLYVSAFACSVEETNDSAVSGVSGGQGNWQLQNWGTSGCIDIEGQGNFNGARVHMWSCHGGWSQIWYFREIAQGKYQLYHKGGRCLDVSNGDSSNGAKMQLWDCTLGHPNQVFYLDHVSYSKDGMPGYQLVNSRTNKALAQINSSAQVGQNGNRSGKDVMWTLHFR